ncbi:MAG: O-antigen ligase family protein [Firmicutes bacterium]|nr:O-antigen ligase family protein [Bacillota bacterium]
MKFLIFASGIISALGLLVMFTKGSFKFFGYTLGIFNNRFLGVYTNSNLAGFVSATSVMACDLLNDKYFGNIKESKIKNFLFTIFLFFNIFSLFLTDSNASFVFITIYLVVRIFCESFAKYSSFKETKIFREILFISVCVSIIISSSFLIREFSQQTVNWILNKNDKKIFSIKLIENQDDLEKIHSDKIKIGRENYDVSSGRILLFKQGLILSKIRPLLGIGRGNLVRYAKIYIDGGLIFSDLHNSYLTIIVANGWIGFIIFMMFAISTIFRSARMVFSQNHKRKTKFLSKLFSILIAYFCYAIFEKCILSEITFMVIFLWIILGYISTVLESEHRS